MSCQSIYDRVTHFSEVDKRELMYPELMNGIVVWIVDTVRDCVGWPFIVTDGYRTSNNEGEHPKGNAIDGYFVTDEPYHIQVRVVMDVLEKLNIADAMGIGIYPFGAEQSQKETPSKIFHFDCRGVKARWGYIKSMGGYISFDVALTESQKLWTLSNIE